MPDCAPAPSAQPRSSKLRTSRKTKRVPNRDSSGMVRLKSSSISSLLRELSTTATVPPAERYARHSCVPIYGVSTELRVYWHKRAL